MGVRRGPTVRARCCSVPSLLSAPLCQDLQGQPTASGISGPVIQGERIWYEAPSLGLAGKDQKLGRTRMGWSISLAWLLGSRAGNRILRLDGAVPGKSPQAFSAVCFVPGLPSEVKEQGPFCWWVPQAMPLPSLPPSPGLWAGTSMSAVY